jgi:hypothetical protein
VVTVTTATGTEQVNGTDWTISKTGYLTVVDGNGGDVASYAPGWLSVAGAGAIVSVAAS